MVLSSVPASCAIDIQGATVVKVSVLLVLLALTACAGAPQGQYTRSACSGGEASSACQVERYMNAP
jgi:hypothetical protein